MSALYAAFVDLARAYDETHRERDEARADLVAYAKALVTGNTDAAVRIEKRWHLYGYSPQIVSIGLRAAADGRDCMTAVDEFMEDEPTISELEDGPIDSGGKDLS